MTAALRRRLATLEHAAERRLVQQIAEVHGVNADELFAESRKLDAEVRRLRVSGYSEQATWLQVRERLTEVDRGVVRWCTRTEDSRKPHPDVSGGARADYDQTS